MDSEKILDISWKTILKISIAIICFYLIYSIRDILIWFVFKPRIKNKKNIIYSLLIFFGFLIPQALFEIKNNFLMVRNFFNFNKGDINTDTSTWSIPNLAFIKEGFLSYFDILFSKLEGVPKMGSRFLGWLWLIFSGYQIWRYFKKRTDQDKMAFILIIFLFVPLLFLFYFQEIMEDYMIII